MIGAGSHHVGKPVHFPYSPTHYFVMRGIGEKYGMPEGPAEICDRILICTCQNHDIEGQTYGWICGTIDLQQEIGRDGKKDTWSS